MAELLLFHHVQGATPGFMAFAADLRRAGHTVHTPDLFGGRVFDSLDEGLKFVDEAGFQEILDRGDRAAAGLPGAIVYAGFSLGAACAQRLAQTRSGALGALLFHSCLPFEEFGSEWPAEVPVQIHAMADDPFFAEDRVSADDIVHAARDGRLFLYPGDGHLFADSGSPDHDAGAAAKLRDRALEFLARV